MPPRETNAAPSPGVQRSPDAGQARSAKPRRPGHGGGAQARRANGGYLAAFVRSRSGWDCSSPTTSRTSSAPRRWNIFLTTLATCCATLNTSGRRRNGPTATPGSDPDDARLSEKESRGSSRALRIAEIYEKDLGISGSGAGVRGRAQKEAAAPNGGDGPPFIFAIFITGSISPTKPWPFCAASPGSIPEPGPPERRDPPWPGGTGRSRWRRRLQRSRRKTPSSRSRPRSRNRRRRHRHHRHRIAQIEPAPGFRPKE